MAAPSSTYRLQLTERFGFAEAREIAGYLEALGTGAVYASPILAAREGSPHGYDVVDPTTVNPALGGEDALREAAAAWRERGIGLVVDIVPNHLAASGENPWWWDVLSYGAASEHARTFAIDWSDPSLRDGLLVPVLGAPYGEALAAGDIRLAAGERGLVVRVPGHELPLAPATYDQALRPASSRRPTQAERSLLRAAAAVRGSRDDAQRRRSRGAALTRRVGSAGSAERTFLRRAIAAHDPRSAAGRDRLDALLRAQHWRLAYWRAAAGAINYRRFFDISDLVGVRVEDPHVFDATHAAVLGLVADGVVTGLRIDHIDGLRDPAGYLRRLAGAIEGTAAAGFVVVEKILGPDERLRPGWKAAGTTGYEWLAALGGLAVDPEGLDDLTRVYRRFTGRLGTFDAVEEATKRRAIGELFPAEVSGLTRRAMRLARGDRDGADLTEGALREAIVALTAAMPVYRTYIGAGGASAEDRETVRAAVASAADGLDDEAGRALAFLERVLDPRRTVGGTAQSGRARLDWVARWQQLTGPAMAKGHEDTALYRYHRLAAASEVGANPADPAVSVEDFHALMQERVASRDRSLTTTATHDTKRGEDVRARLAVLTELPGAWERAVRGWSRALRDGGGPAATIDPNDEYLLWQTLAGSWPLSPAGRRGYRDRIEAYMIKAAREAKEATSWNRPDEKAERALAAAVRRALSDPAIRDSVDRFARRIAWHGALVSLSQTLLKIAGPGVPDVYQGTERWSTSLVDPDNRRPVDFAGNARALRAMDREAGRDTQALIASLLRDWEDGRVKLYLTSRALRHRREHAALFERGDYLPMTARGPRAGHVVAFARRRGRAWAVAVAPRLTFRLAPNGAPLGRDAWGNATLALPRGAPRHWRNLLTGETLEARNASLRLGEVLGRFPVALLRPA